MIFRVKAESPEIEELYTEHDRAYKHDAGYDLIIPDDTMCLPRQVTFIDHKISAEMKALHEEGTTYYVSYFIIPRSSISKTPLMLANSIGLIDAGYRGNLLAPLFNWSDEPYMIEAGTRLFQVILPSLEYFKVEFIKSFESLSFTERGENGFGSSTKN